MWTGMGGGQYLWAVQGSLEIKHLLVIGCVQRHKSQREGVSSKMRKSS